VRFSAAIVALVCGRHLRAWLPVVHSETQGKHGRFGHGWIGCLRETWREGAVAFWRGTLPRVCHITPLAAVQFGVYEFACRMLEPPF
jgi:hypothetical protein